MAKQGYTATRAAFPMGEPIPGLMEVRRVDEALPTHFYTSMELKGPTHSRFFRRAATGNRTMRLPLFGVVIEPAWQLCQRTAKKI
jgi:hypothetical protein